MGVDRRVAINRKSCPLRVFHGLKAKTWDLKTPPLFPTKQNENPLNPHKQKKKKGNYDSVEESMPQLNHNHCRLLSRASLRKHNAVNQHGRHRVAYTKTLFQKPLEIKTRQMQVMNSTYKSWWQTKFNTKIAWFSKNGNNRSQKAYNQADCLHKVSATHSPDLSHSQKEKENIIWSAWAHYYSVLFFSLILELNSTHPILHVTSDHWPAILPVHFLDPPTTGGGKTKEFSTQLRKIVQKFNLKPNTDVVPYSLHLVICHLKSHFCFSLLCFHHVFI